MQCHSCFMHSDNYITFEDKVICNTCFNKVLDSQKPAISLKVQACVPPEVAMAVAFWIMEGPEHAYAYFRDYNWPWEQLKEWVVTIWNDNNLFLNPSERHQALTNLKLNLQRKEMN